MNMKIRLTSKALSGKSVTLILEQDGRSAGPLTVADWGGTTQAEETPAPPSPAPPPPAPGPGLDGGIVSITVDRTSLRCAPDSVRLGVDLSNSTFDTPGPAPGANYDPRLHELVYIWDTGDTGEWSAPQNVLAEWNDKSKGRGPWIAHCYDAPGTYTVRLTVIEPSSGKQAQATASITVEDPNDVYAGAETVCINPPGDDNFTGAPDGAMTVQMDGVSVKVRDQSWWNSVKGNTKRRFLLKAGATYGPVAFELNYSDDPPHFYLGTYGSGTV
ncbi:PKD domain-containing protein, partial [Rhodovulum sp.]|uniref:PKD domain-containing protein n=1 Tax=Rhodovulum sp. TaxID=34009 RepID=UPI001850FAAB